MKIGVLLGVLCVVAGTVGSTVESDGISNTSEPIIQNDIVSMPETTMKIMNVTTTEKIENKSTNHDDETVYDLSSTDRSVNESNNSIIIPVSDSNISKANEKPKNIILVMVEGNESGNSWEQLKENHSFNVEGLIQSCKIQEKSNDSSIVDAAHDKICDCNKLLKYNIRELIEYARVMKGMNTAILSEDNFTLPTLGDFDNSPHQSILIGNRDNVVPISTSLELLGQLTNDSRSRHNNEKRSAPTHFSTKTSTADTANIPKKHHKNNNRDYIWDFFDMMMKIRLDFFKNLFDSLHKSPVFNINHKKINLRKSSLVFPIQQSQTLIELISNTFIKFQRIPNDNGFLMIIVAPHNELSAIYQIIQSQSSTKVDLVIILGLEHTHDKKTVFYVANGPGSNYLSNLQTIYELPLKVKLILDHCQGICEHKELPNSTLLPMESFPPKRRVVRSDDEETSSDEEKPEKESSETESGNEETDVANRDDESHEKQSSAGFSFHFQKDYITISVMLIQPTEEMSKLIRVELNENLETREKDLEYIKEWLKKEPHLPDEYDDLRLMTFLRGCKFSLEKCKKKLDMYFTMRGAVPEFFTNRDVTRPEVRDLTKFIQIPPLPGLTKNGRRVVVMRGLNKDIPTPNVAEAMKLVMMIGDIRLKEEVVGVAGDVYILDASVATPAHFTKFTPSLVKKFLICVQEAYPVKLKEIHVVNVSPLVDSIVNFVKPFLKEKIRNRIFMHSDFKTLYDYIPREMLPTEYGGDAGPIEEINETWVKKLEEYGPWFKEQESVKSNEALRTGKPKTQDDLFGIDGSFRQLSFD
ncbi:hypothetical protein PV327_006558 [Microctonus hyperodae]|uniref:CRAL-TRIO domain-containing protein n=1 Tax=Microctonus hyperodae TaxID=165561 RepID=A0AA39F4I2_MICHY|nr:hypothetical protein PV327_006558 [Microctonus hyperodae]